MWGLLKVDLSRVAAGLAGRPGPFIAQARALRAPVLRHPSGHLQRTTAYFLSLGHYDALVLRMGGLYGDGGGSWTRPSPPKGWSIAGRRFGGSWFWMRAPDDVDTAAMAMVLRARGC